MSEPVAVTWARVADGFTEVAASVTSEQWSAASPCEGWTARDVVRHLVEWVPPFLAAGAQLDVSVDHHVDADPVAAWNDLDRRVRAVLADPNVGNAVFRHDMAGTHPLETAIDRFVLPDVLIHTWDVARAAGREVVLDRTAVEQCVDGMEAAGDMLVASGHYGPRIEVAPDADPQTRLIAASGRRPSTHRPCLTGRMSSLGGDWLAGPD